MKINIFAYQNQVKLKLQRWHVWESSPLPLVTAGESSTTKLGRRHTYHLEQWLFSTSYTIARVSREPAWARELDELDGLMSSVLTVAVLHQIRIRLQTKQPTW